MGTRRASTAPTDVIKRKRAKYTDEKNNDLKTMTKRLMPTRRAKNNKNDKDDILPRKSSDLEISSMPVEIILEILLYLDYRDLHSLRQVSKFFQQLMLEPRVWTAWEVNSAGPSTSGVLKELKRMTHLKRISIEARTDCDDILKQLSSSNKKLLRLGISHCTGSTADLYLRPVNLIRILERCSRLHTITIKGSRFRGLKFYRLLGLMGHRLQFVSASMTSTQFRTFAKHISNLDERETDALCTMCTGRTKEWGPLRYYMVERSDRSKSAMISFFCNDFLYVDVRSPTGQSKITTKVGANNPLCPTGMGCS